MTACGRLSLHRICRLVAQRVVSLRFQCLDAIGVKADIARASRAYQSEAIVESPGGISPPGAPKTVREPLDSHGSRCSAVSMT
jgi:hypothetical protein